MNPCQIFQFGSWKNFIIVVKNWNDWLLLKATAILKRIIHRFYFKSDLIICYIRFLRVQIVSNDCSLRNQNCSEPKCRVTSTYQTCFYMCFRIFFNSEYNYQYITSQSLFLFQKAGGINVQNFNTKILYFKYLLQV